SHLLDVDLRPGAARTTGAVALQEGHVVEPLAWAVDPAEAERAVEGVGDRDGRQPRVPLGDPQPDLGCGLVVLLEPRLPGGEVRWVDPQGDPTPPPARVESGGRAGGRVRPCPTMTSPTVRCAWVRCCGSSTT